MTPDEKQLLTDLANKIAQTPAPQRDPEAEELIRTRIGSRPDALYLMTQTVLIQNLALDHASQEIEQLKQQAGQAPGRSPGGSFLGGAPGAPPQYQQQAPQQPQYAPQYQQGYGQPQPPQYAPPPPQSGPGSSFLATAAKTVAGVAAGALAFEGIRSLFHSGGGGGFGMPGGSGFLGGGGGGFDRPGETVINNYYDNPNTAVEDPIEDDQNVDEQSVDDQSYDDQAVDDSSDDNSGNDDSSDGVT